jgi:hypothetical protein
MVTNVTTTQVWTLADVNTAKVGRLHDGVLLAQGTSSSPNTSWRSGVIATTVIGATLGDLQVIAKSPESLQCDVYPGNAVVSRASQGPYEAMFTGVSTVTFDAAHATLPRIDRVDIVVNDTALGDGGSLGAVITVTTGTAAASPSVPSDPAPGRSIPLAEVARPANDNTISNSNITDKRKSTAPLGATRVLLPGDSLTDPGIMWRERVDTILKEPSAPRVREWDGVVWRDEDLYSASQRGFRYDQTSQQTGLSNVTDIDIQLQTATISSPHVTVSGTGNTRFTLNREGWWTLTAGLGWNEGGPATGTLRSFIYDYTVSKSVAGMRTPCDVDTEITHNLTALVYIFNGAPRQFALRGWHNTGGTMVTTEAPIVGDTFFAGVWLGK